MPDGSPAPDFQVSILPAHVMNLVWHPGDTRVADLDLSVANLPPGILRLRGDLCAVEQDGELRLVDLLQKAVT